MTIQLIDTCPGLEPKSWAWEVWYHIGEAPDSLADKNESGILLWLRLYGYLSRQSNLAIEDDGCNLVIVNRSTREPRLVLSYTDEP